MAWLYSLTSPKPFGSIPFDDQHPHNYYIANREALYV